MINWSYYPQSDKPSDLVIQVVQVFEDAADTIASSDNELRSNDVLRIVSNGLTAIGFQVETGKTAAKKIIVPVLFGRNGKLLKKFNADAYYPEFGFVIEVEAGRGVINNQFLKDLFQACMMQDVDYLAIAVRNQYRNRPDFEKVLKFFDTLYASNRLQLPLKGILVIGY